MDKLYIGDIPSQYHYAVFNNGYITLYNKASGHNEILPYYRIYQNNGGFYYSQGETSFSQYTTTYFQDLEVTDEFWYRSDFADIIATTFFIAFFFVLITNIITSFIKRGGLLGGLF